MARALQFAHILLAIALTVAVGASVWGACGFTRHLIIAVDRWGAAAPTAGKTDAVLDHINRPCKGASGPDACGTLAQINKTVIDAGDAIVRTQLIERSTQPHIISAMDEFGQTAKHLSSTADSLKGTADAITGTARGATETLSAAQTDLKTLDTSLTAFPPLLERSTATVGDLDALLKDKAVYGTLDNVQSMTSSGSAILIDARTLADKTTGDILKPKPWWQKIGPYGNDLVRAGCLLTGRCP